MLVLTNLLYETGMAAQRARPRSDIARRRSRHSPDASVESEEASSTAVATSDDVLDNENTRLLEEEKSEYNWEDNGESLAATPSSEIDEDNRSIGTLQDILASMRDSEYPSTPFRGNDNDSDTQTVCFSAFFLY